MPDTLSLNCNCDMQQNILYRGTTPIFNFAVDLDTSLLNLEQTHIVFTSGSGVADKVGSDITIGENLMTCSLLQEETLSFTGTRVNIQILVTMSNGQKAASTIMYLPVFDTLVEGAGW